MQTTIAKARLGAKLGSGLVGSLILNGIHELARQMHKDTPRMDRVGQRGIQRLRLASGRKPLGQPALYATGLAADVLSNTAYYAALFTGRAQHPLLRGIVGGVLAGIGAAIVPPLIGLAPPQQKLRTAALTVAWYALGGIAAAVAYRASNRSRLRRDA